MNCPEPPVLQRNLALSVDRIAELKLELAQSRAVVLIYACGCQAPTDLPNRCPVHGSHVQQMTRALCCEE